MGKEERDDFNVVQGATLTLLGLIIGFSFAMAVSRYDQRKNNEESEANAIGTEYLRCDLLPDAERSQVKQLLKKFVDQRVVFYETRDAARLEQVKQAAAQIGSEMWSAVTRGAEKRQTPATTLVISGLNDVLNAQGYTEATWLNRIPIAAWSLMATLAIFGCLLVGNGAHRPGGLLSMVLPLALSIAFFLIADMDSPRGGLIRVRPQNLVSLSETLAPH